MTTISCKSYSEKSKEANEKDNDAMEEAGEELKYYCCTSHQSPHCALELKDLQETHPPNESYTRN